MNVIQQALSAVQNQFNKEKQNSIPLNVASSVGGNLAKQYLYNNGRVLPSSPYWKTADAGNEYPVGSPQRMQAKLLAPTDSMIMAGVTGPLKKKVDEQTMYEIDGIRDYLNQTIKRSPTMADEPVLQDADRIASTFLNKQAIDKMVQKSAGQAQNKYFLNLLDLITKESGYQKL